jgi:hypothetical protein
MAVAATLSPSASPVPSEDERQGMLVIGKMAKCRVLFDHTTDEEDELSLKEGDTIVIMEKASGEWWRGYAEDSDKIGLFPSAYVQEIGGGMEEGMGADDSHKESQPEAEMEVDDAQEDQEPVKEPPVVPVVVKPVASKRATQIANTISQPRLSDPSFLAMPPFLRQQKIAEMKAQEAKDSSANPPGEMRIFVSNGTRQFTDALCCDCYLYVSLTGGTEFFVPDGFYLSAVLKKTPLPGNVDPSSKEQWLSDEEFMHIFGTVKDSFLGLPKWKQSAQKKKHGLF